MWRYSCHSSSISGNIGVRFGELSSLEEEEHSIYTIPKTRVTEQVNVMVVSGHTVTCPSSGSTDEERTIPSVATWMKIN